MLLSVGTAPIIPARAVSPDRRAQVRAPSVSLRLRADRWGDGSARHPPGRSPHDGQNPDALGGEVPDHRVGLRPIPGSPLRLDVLPIHDPAHGRGSAGLEREHILGADVPEVEVQPEETRRGGGSGLRRWDHEQRGENRHGRKSHNSSGELCHSRKARLRDASERHATSGGLTAMTSRPCLGCRGQRAVRWPSPAAEPPADALVVPAF